MACKASRGRWWYQAERAGGGAGRRRMGELPSGLRDGERDYAGVGGRWLVRPGRCRCSVAGAALARPRSSLAGSGVLHCLLGELDRLRDRGVADQPDSYLVLHLGEYLRGAPAVNPLGVRDPSLHFIPGQPHL